MHTGCDVTLIYVQILVSLVSSVHPSGVGNFINCGGITGFISFLQGCLWRKNTIISFHIKINNYNDIY